MFNPDYKDLLSLFTERGVEYVVVGAYAMAAHGVVRATGRAKDRLDLELLKETDFPES
jgi:hypothetical protein